MRRISWLLVFALLLTPQAAGAIQLFWTGGSTDLTVSQNTQAILVVKADSTEGTLPNTWRLQWTTDSLKVQLSAFDPNQACLADTAKVDSIAPPSTPADSAANQVTAYFCSSGSNNATTAYFLADLIAGSHGKMKIVALNPADTTQVIESNEVTFNGGVDGEYAPVVLSASSSHQSLQLSVSAVGANLAGASSLSIVATNGSWSLPLTVTSQGASSITGVASVAALLPACQASVASQGARLTSALLAADPPMQLDVTESCDTKQFFDSTLVAPPGYKYAIQPKDFSFTPGFVDPASSRYALHLFYIRHSYYNISGDDNEKNIGHVWSSDLTTWHSNPCRPSSCDPCRDAVPDTCAISVRTGKFDALHVWAPSIVRVGPTYNLFYTGVKNESGRRNQRIGVTTSTDLTNWTPVDTALFSSSNVPWASKNPASYPGQQLRDPFVMEYPVGSGHYLMYFVAVDSLHYPRMAVGVATSTDLRIWTAQTQPFLSTERATQFTGAQTIESPHIFLHNGQWWMPYTVDGDQVFFETNSHADPSDADSSHWSRPVWLRGVTEDKPWQLQYWHATEHLGSGATEWLAAFNDSTISIDIRGVSAADSVGVDSLLLGCPPLPPPAAVGDPYALSHQLGLVVLHPHLGAAGARVRLELPSPSTARLALYDVAGRRLATLLSRSLPAGVTDVDWNGTDDSGARVASGVYFVRLSCGSGARVSKVVMLR